MRCDAMRSSNKRHVLCRAAGCMRGHVCLVCICGRILGEYEGEGVVEQDLGAGREEDRGTGNGPWLAFTGTASSWLALDKG